MPDTIVDAHWDGWTLTTPLIVAATSFYTGAVIWLKAWRGR